MTEPTSLNEYLEAFAANQKMSGHGSEAMAHFPCPFCAEQDFIVARVLDTREALGTEATCRACGRSARADVRDEANAVSFQMYQTGGPPQPRWLEPKMPFAPDYRGVHLIYKLECPLNNPNESDSWMVSTKDRVVMTLCHPNTKMIEAMGERVRVYVRGRITDGGGFELIETVEDQPW